MSTAKAIINFVLAVLLAAPVVTAQGSDDAKSSNLNGFFGFEGLRPNNPDQIYDIQYLKDSTYIYKKASADVEFVLEKKLEFNHDNQGFVNEELEYLILNDSWRLSKKNNFQYNPSGTIEYRITRNWDDEASLFVNSERRFYNSNNYGLVETEVVEVFILEHWRSFRKYTYQYNANLEIEEELKYLWNEELMNWSPSQKIVYTYNNNNTLNSELTQVWIESSQSWVNETISDFYYNDRNQLINLTESNWNPSAGEWEEKTFQSLTYTTLGQIEDATIFDFPNVASGAQESVEASYDQNGNLNTTVFRRWDIDQDLLVNAEKQVHFWSEQFVGNLTSNVEGVTCFYNNPHIVGLPWFCEGLMKNEVYQLSVFDHTGVLHHQQEFKGGDTFRISNQLQNGLYLVIIEGGLSRHSEKVLIRN
ncbi:MAG: T9SS type A sorting domain-containing protein [Bacteroidota bacterium]